MGLFGLITESFRMPSLVSVLYRNQSDEYVKCEGNGLNMICQSDAHPLNAMQLVSRKRYTALFVEGFRGKG